MRRIFLALLLLIAACGTRPPLPPECQGPLTPINPASTSSGAFHEAGPRA